LEHGGFRRCLEVNGSILSHTQYPKLNWITVIENLDHPGFSVSDTKGFNALLATFRKATNEAFPLSLLYDRVWDNRAGQLSMIKFALATPDLHLDNACKKQPPLEIHSVKTSLLQSHWYSTGLVETLLQLSESESHQVIRTLFEQPLKNQPELLVLGLAQAKTTWGSSTLHSELSTLLLAIFLGNHPNSSFVLHKLWALNPGMVVRGIVEMYFKDVSVLPKILGLAQDFKGLARVLEARPFSFAIDLAALAAHRDFLNLEIWLQDRIDEHGVPFVRSVVTYLKKDAAYLSKSEPQRSFTLSQVAVDTFYGILRNNLPLIPPENLEELKKLNNIPSLFTPPEEEPATTGEHPGFPAAVEEGANSYFQKIYTGQMSIDELIGLLKNFKSSADSRESDIFACMIHNLFDEYRFFPKYPDKELSITAVLFGALIQNQLVSFLPLGVALRHVLDALRKPPSSKMFKFGLIALDQFKSRLYEWPQYCSHILQIAHVRQFHPEIVQFIEAGLEAPVGLPDPFHAGPPGLGTPEADLPPGLAADVPQPAHMPPTIAEKKSPTPPPARPPAAKLPPATGKLAIPIDTLTTTDVSFAQPSIQIQDRVAFIVNNISPTNLVDKVRELLATLTATETPYFAHYVVTKRVSIEPNFHALYLSMCEKVSVKLRQLFPRLVDFTVEGIKNLLASDKVKRDISERTLLKNLGTWLGIVTLGKDKPILWNQLGLKDLLLQGFDDDNLVAVVPLVAKIMDATGHSRVFRLPNPWTMSILRLLVEIYRIPDLKLNLKFEVEVLCNSLGVELNTIPPSNLLENRQKPSEEVSLANLARHVRINPQITLFQIQPTLKKYVPIAVERAVQDIMHPVVERSVTIACVTTRELVLKDFALDPDSKKLQRAAQVMVQNLASSLALVTCKEPLRASIAAVLWPAFQPHSTDTVLIEQAITMICNDNIELATSMIERAATKKAQHDIEEALLPAFQLRTQWAERRPMNGHFVDPQHVQPPRPPTLPDFLAPRQTGVSQLQLKVYEAFGEPARVHETGEVPPQDHVDFAAKVSSFFPTLDQLIQTKVAGSELSASSELGDLFQALVDSTGRNPALVMVAARLILEHMQQLFSNLPLELYSQLLVKLDAVARIAPTLTTLLLQDQQNQFPELTASLIKHRLVDLGAIDSTIAQWISVNSNTVKLATYLIQTCLIDEAVLTANDLTQTLTMLEKLVAQKIKGSEQLDQLVRFARGARPVRKETPELESRQPVQKILNEWLQIASQPSYTDKGYVQFVARLQQQDLLKADANTQKFLRICTEVCLEATVAKLEGSALNYTAIDALSKLIVFLVKHHPDQADMSRIAFLSLFLEVAVQHLIRDFEVTTSNFNQRPYFRLLSNLLIELNQPDPALEALHFPILVTFSNVFIALQPSRIPAFSFAWLELISHRMFMPKLLLSKPPKGWPYFQRVLIELFKVTNSYFFFFFPPILFSVMKLRRAD
jgi:CCR4-NOT transcription complex subunit 1